jgi:hypothetical protein
MPAIVTAAELRTVLGVSSSLYSDAYLEGIIDSAEGVILPMLTAYQSAVSGVYLSNNVAYYLTQRPNQFVEGQSVVVTGCVPDLFNGTITITSNASNLYPPFSYAPPFSYSEFYYSPLYTFSAALVAVLSGASAATLYADNAPVESAILVVSVEIFQSITAPGGQIEGVDFAPSPFRMGRSLQNRVVGLLSPFLEVETICQ